MPIQIGEKTRQEIEAKLATMGEYVKMDYLQRALQSNLDFDTRKFALVKLAGLYEARTLYADAAKLMKSAADINTTFRAKIQDYMKAVEMSIKAGDFDEADVTFKLALALGNDREKMEMKDNFKKYHMAQGQYYLKVDKRNQARKSYEKLLSLDLTLNEKAEIQSKLLVLYERLGLVREYYNLKKSS